MRKIIAPVTLFLLTFPLVLSANNGNGLVPCGPGTGKEHCELCDLFQLIVNVIEFFLITIVPPIAALFFIWGGITFYTAMGEPDKVTKGRKILTSVAIGVVIVYGAHILVTSFLGAVGVIDAQWPNIDIGC